MWMWIGGSICGVLVVAAIILIVVLNIKESKKKRQTLEDGDHTTAWLVQANNKLFEDGIMDQPGLVLISPDKATSQDEELMTDLAERIMDLKGEDPDDLDDKAERKIAELMLDETYIEGRRDKLPKSFTQGKEVYLAHIYIYRDHLPGKKLKRRRIPCAVIWDDPESLICTRPATKKDRRRDDDDEDDE